MRRNNFIRYNLHQYDEKLSFFGRQVLRTLIKQQNEKGFDRENNPNKYNATYNHHPKPRTSNAPRRKCLIFEDASQNVPNREINRNDDFTSTDRQHKFQKSVLPVEHPSTILPLQIPIESFNEERESLNILSPPPVFTNHHLPLAATSEAVVTNDDEVNFVFSVESHIRARDGLALKQVFDQNIKPRHPNKSSVTSKCLPSIATLKENSSLEIPTSVELFTTTNLPLVQKQEQLTRNDLITTMDTNECSQLRPDECQNRNLDLFAQDNHNKNNISSQGHGRILENQNIDWNDMFDTELISDINDPVNSDNVNTFQICFPKDNAKAKGNEAAKEPKANKKDSIKSANSRTKEKQTKVTESLTKKVKKVNSNTMKNSKGQIKQKRYSDNVTSWLKKVDPNNTVEDYREQLEPGENTTKHSNQCYKIDIDTSKKATTKKCSSKNVIQAQLANKGGIMKFDKPKEKNAKTEIKTADLKTDHEEKYKTKDKKMKSKFIAPIKSQIPVKDITYEILEFKEDTCHMAKESFNQCNEYGIVLVLIYNNGFCQLNEQHTDDACASEGLLFYSDQKIFYLDKNQKDIADLLSKVLGSNILICYEGKAIVNFLESKFGSDVKKMMTNIFDVKIAGALLAPDSLPENFADLQKVAGSSAEFTVATECPRQKTAWYASLLQGAAAKLREKLINENLWNLFVEIEMQLLPIIAGMERNGVCVDLQKLNAMDIVLQKQMKHVEEACAKAAGRPFQLTSHVQIRSLIYDELQLDKLSGLAVRGTVTTGAKSTSEAMLRSLSSVHPLPKLILEYRQLHKMYTTFVAGIKQHVRGGIVKPTWVQTAAATGRIASNNPNLQAIPKTPFHFTEFSGSQDSGATCKSDSSSLLFRSVYVAKPGHVILAADWRHVECRVFARAAADTALQKALEAPDLFRRLASDWLKKPEDDVSSADRERTKRIVYASLYGAGARKLMDILDVDYGQALSIGASFDRTFPALRQFGKEVAERCRAANGRVESLCGRTRRLPHICSEDQQLRAQAERQALNFIVQGSAADICKWATVVATRAISERGLHARLLLTIHDELVWEVLEDDLPAAAEVIKEAMESSGARAGLVSLPVALAAGPSWGELRPYPSPDLAASASPPLPSSGGLVIN